MWKIRQIEQLWSNLLPQMTILESLRFEIIDGAAVTMNLELLFKFQILYLRIFPVIFFHNLQNKCLFLCKKKSFPEGPGIKPVKFKVFFHVNSMPSADQINNTNVICLSIEISLLVGHLVIKSSQI